jgi:predicted AlkP superfamily phosphohydrolase/phosphomutase
MEENRVLIIGLDGATLDLIRPWAAQGYLPNLQKLMAQGAWGEMQSTIQPITAPAWTSMITGVNQGKHGLYDFVRRKADSYAMEVTNASHVSAPTIFDLASQQNKRVIAINVPYTFPPRPVNGICIGGPFAPVVSPELVHPVDFFTRLKEIAPHYFILPDYDATHADPLGEYARQLKNEVELREQVSLALMKEEDWDLFMVVIMATDEVQHAYWHCMDARPGDALYPYRDVIREIYQRADEAIGKLLAAVEQEADKPTYVFIASDHGFGQLKYMINLNRWLVEQGFMAFQPAAENRVGSIKSKTVKRLATAYRRYLPSKARKILRTRMGNQTFERMKGEIESALFTSGVDWPSTRVYALGAGGNLYVNLQGREPQGIVAPGEEYEDLRSNVIQSLQELKDPDTGEALVKRTFRREELYQGPFVERAPDLIIQWRDYAYWGRGRYDSHAPVFEGNKKLDFTEIPLTGTHRPQGILIASGPGIATGTHLQDSSLLDVAPTVLGLLGLPGYAALDGVFLQAAFKAEVTADILQSSKVADQAVNEADYQFTQEESKIIEDHLRSLGYL